MSKKEYYLSTPREFYNRVAGFNKYQRELSLDSWHRMRVLAAVVASASGNIKGGLKPEDVVTLPGDKKKVLGIMTAEERKAFIERAEKRHGRTL